LKTAMQDRKKALEFQKDRERAIEKDLATRAVNGDVRAFTSIVERYQKPIFNLCYRYLGASEAEDAAQDTFVRAFVHKSRFDPEKPLLPWLMTISRRLCIDRLRKTRREPISEDEGLALPDPSPTAEDDASSKQEIALLSKGLNELPQGSREAIALYHLNGLSYEETAQALEVPVGTVMTWLYRGRAKLKKIIAEAHGFPRVIEGGHQ
jgi:RNA polymerase sigma-70 factor, ECF subfamily